MKGLEGEDLELVNDFKERTYKAIKDSFFGRVDSEYGMEYTTAELVGSALGIAKFVANIHVCLSNHLKDRYTEEQINKAISGFLSESISNEIDRLKGK